MDERHVGGKVNLLGRLLRDDFQSVDADFHVSICSFICNEAISGKVA